MDARPSSTSLASMRLSSSLDATCACYSQIRIRITIFMFRKPVDLRGACALEYVTKITLIRYSNAKK